MEILFVYLFFSGLVIYISFLFGDCDLTEAFQVEYKDEEIIFISIFNAKQWKLWYSPSTIHQWESVLGDHIQEWCGESSEWQG